MGSGFAPVKSPSTTSKYIPLNAKFCSIFRRLAAIPMRAFRLVPPDGGLLVISEINECALATHWESPIKSQYANRLCNEMNSNNTDINFKTQQVHIFLNFNYTYYYYIII